MARAVSSGVCIAPMRYSSAYPRTLTSGVRSSWLASPMNRRIFSTVASRSENDSSTRSSMVLIAILSRPTSVRGSMSVARCEKSPSAIAVATSSTCVSRRKASVMSHLVPSAPTMMVRIVIVVNTPMYVVMNESTSVSGCATSCAYSVLDEDPSTWIVETAAR